MTSEVRYFIIFGLTQSGTAFRPSDWAERLAGVLAPYRPAGTLGGHLSYSPYAVPTVIDGVRSIVIDERLRELEPLAWKFVHDFAKDNNLKTESDLATDPLKRH
ncbi:DUF3579 domain-containing protein [Zwartia panacis]|uniref:DUF3579 domain-containing protein n=1 Tax=Zwartia panacis TaxID=2683345 RepID=UPI0025B5BA39|nr:DUF3579 domain-containing protein [Zwartia panacis]MDN4016958.1 DUF3579 domain-containing protein [Zwartia panacis]